MNHLAIPDSLIQHITDLSKLLSHFSHCGGLTVPDTSTICPLQLEQQAKTYTFKAITITVNHDNNNIKGFQKSQIPDNFVSYLLEACGILTFHSGLVLVFKRDNCFGYFQTKRGTMNQCVTSSNPETAKMGILITRGQTRKRPSRKPSRNMVKSFEL